MAVKETNKRSILKGISWRLIGSADTILIAYFITGNITKAISIGGAEVVTKLFFYYLHERAWVYFNKGRKDSRIKSLIKAITWRITGTLDTTLISFIIISIGNQDGQITKPFYKASAIGSIELFTKIILFYFHERIWNRIKYGKKEVEDESAQAEITSKQVL